MSDSLKHRMEIAAAAAWEAGKVTLRYFQTDLSVELKRDQTPVTIADKESEEALFSILLSEHPGDGFLGEERGVWSGSSGYTWIVDPIDGTKSFIQGVPLYGVMVGLENQKGDPVVGAVCFPALGELIVAARGEGCHWNSLRARVSQVAQLSQSCVVYTSPRNFASHGSLFERLQGRVKICRGWGDCYGHILVATGRAEAMLDPVLSDWDCVALLPILEEAGGTFTDWSGNRTARGKSGISTNGKVLTELMDLIENRPEAQSG